MFFKKKLSGALINISITILYFIYGIKLKETLHNLFLAFKIYTKIINEIKYQNIKLK